MFKDRFIAGSVRLCVCLGLTCGTTDKVASVIVFVGCVLCLFPFFTLTLTPCLSLVFERFNYLKHFLYHLSRSALFPCCLINVAQLLDIPKNQIIYVRFLLAPRLFVLIFYGRKFSKSHKNFTPYIQSTEHFNNFFLLIQFKFFYFYFMWTVK